MFAGVQFRLCAHWVSQAEHGPETSVWLVTDDNRLVCESGMLIPIELADLPNSDVVETSWAKFGEVVLCEDRREMPELANRYAKEKAHP